MAQLKAVLWDVDGTLAESERDGHRVAFNLAFDALGLPWRWSAERYDFFHFRDRYDNEVDIVIENQDGQVVGIEVKASATVRGTCQ